LGAHNAYNPFGAGVRALQTPQKRNVYFAFHFADIMRVNDVRNAWKIDQPDAPQMRSFYDSSLWESRQSESPESLKRLTREGVEHTSAVCALVGSRIASRRRVRYEIARAVVDERGLLAVHLNNIPHCRTRQRDPWGPNPLEFMAVGRVQPNWMAPPKYYLYEWNGQMWVPYDDYVDAVRLPPYLRDPAIRNLTQLSSGTSVYDYVNDDGHKNIGSWIDRAAQQVGR
jgi:hypothetical protein